MVNGFRDQIDKNTVENTVELLEANFSNATDIDTNTEKKYIENVDGHGIQDG